MFLNCNLIFKIEHFLKIFRKSREGLEATYFNQKREIIDLHRYFEIVSYHSHVKFSKSKFTLTSVRLVHTVLKLHSHEPVNCV